MKLISDMQRKACNPHVGGDEVQKFLQNSASSQSTRITKPHCLSHVLIVTCQHPFSRFCKGCELFLGHGFEDGVAKGDTHPEARWRH